MQLGLRTTTREARLGSANAVIPLEMRLPGHRGVFAQGMNRR